MLDILDAVAELDAAPVDPVLVLDNANLPLHHHVQVLVDGRREIPPPLRVQVRVSDAVERLVPGEIARAILGAEERRCTRGDPQDGEKDSARHRGRNSTPVQAGRKP
jgi:hypothetical protein